MRSSQGSPEEPRMEAAKHIVEHGRSAMIAPLPRASCLMRCVKPA